MTHGLGLMDKLLRNSGIVTAETFIDTTQAAMKVGYCPIEQFGPELERNHNKPFGFGCILTRFLRGP